MTEAEYTVLCEKKNLSTTTFHAEMVGEAGVAGVRLLITVTNL